jgi:hypothetical protein
MRPPPSRTGASTNKDVRPLTRRYIGTGEPYERLPEVEEQLRHVLPLEEQELVAVIQHDYKSAGHIKDETLCYLIRERVRDGRDVDANAVAEVLLRRHARTISSRVRRGGIEERHREDCAAEIVSLLLIELFDMDSDDGEFAQVRFGLHFDRLSRTVIGRFLRLQRAAGAKRLMCWTLSPMSTPCRPRSAHSCVMRSHTSQLNCARPTFFATTTAGKSNPTRRRNLRLAAN